MIYNIISTGSKGNAVQLFGDILIDCGVPFKLLADCYKDLKLVLLTHEHSDHINRSTVKRLAYERPTLRWGCCEWMVPIIAELVPHKQIDVLRDDVWHDYGAFRVSPFRVCHNVPNCGYRLSFAGKLVFYATDCGDLDGICAKGYDLYMIEANHDEEEIEARAQEKVERGQYAYEFKAAENHLSEEQAGNWLMDNMLGDSEYVFLHQHC